MASLTNLNTNFRQPLPAIGDGSSLNNSNTNSSLALATQQPAPYVPPRSSSVLKYQELFDL